MLRWTDRDLQNKLGKFDERVEAATFATMEMYAPKVQSDARTNAPWTDRTSNARNGLMAQANNRGTVHEIVLFHSVPYGPWLEVRNSGRFRIIVPTIEKMGPIVMGALTGLAGRL